MSKSTFNNISENIGSGIHQDVFCTGVIPSIGYIVGSYLLLQNIYGRILKIT